MLLTKIQTLFPISYSMGCMHTGRRDFSTHCGNRYAVDTLEIAKRCNLTIELDKPSLPRFPVPEGMDEASYLAKISHGDGFGTWNRPEGAWDRMEILSQQQCIYFRTCTHDCRDLEISMQEMRFYRFSREWPEQYQTSFTSKVWSEF